MRHNRDTHMDYTPTVNNMFLKRWHDNKNLVVDFKPGRGQALEDLLMNLDAIKSRAEAELGPFDNIDIRMQ